MAFILDTSILVPIITSIVSFAASFLLATNKSRHDLAALDRENKNEIEKLTRKFEIDLESYREKHKLELESKDKDHQHAMEIKRLEHENLITQKQRELEDSLKYGLAKDAMANLLGGFINSSGVQKAMMDKFNDSFFDSLKNSSSPED